MASCSGASSSVVDLCDDNDNAGISSLNIPGGNTESFERSCDNPECSAPRLISQVPKPETSEFVIDPMVVQTPTLINGFTTVFQIDGIATTMENIMNESNENSTDGNNKPRTIFRVVPNTHAHIVNYVVVDAAGETMRKIKANDAETMRKLLVSQRLSADQMLKKLIGNAIDNRTRIENLNNAAESGIPTSTASVSRAPRAEVATPKVPSGITIKLLSASEINKSASTSASSGNAPPGKKLPVRPPANKTADSSTSTAIKNLSKPPSLPTRPPPGNNIAVSKPVVWQAVSPGNQQTVVSPTKVLKKSVLEDIEKTIASKSLAVSRKLIDSHSNKQQSTLKRKLDSATPVSEAIKRLRPRSPNRTQNSSSVATPQPIVRKLPTLPNGMQWPHSSQKPSAHAKGHVIGPKISIKTTEDINITKLSDTTLIRKSSISIDSENEEVSSPPAHLELPVRRKNKPLMGPASKMKALKALAETKGKAQQNETRTQCKQPLITEADQVKIGETVIYRTGSVKNSKEGSKAVESVTKRCSVAVTDIAKSNSTPEADNDCKPKRSKQIQARKSSEKEVSVTSTNKRVKEFEALVDRYRGRLAIKKGDEFSTRKHFGARETRSSTTSKTSVGTPQRSESSTPDDISDSTLLTTPSAPSRVLRVVLPSTKNGIVNNPPTSPHPNLKISSVISGGTTLPASMREETEQSIIFNDDTSSGSGIEQLQKELADLRRTVARLTQGKNV